jgi:hypothetical protein
VNQRIAIDLDTLDAGKGQFGSLNLIFDFPELWYAGRHGSPNAQMLGSQNAGKLIAKKALKPSSLLASRLSSLPASKIFSVNYQL